MEAAMITSWFVAVVPSQTCNGNYYSMLGLYCDNPTPIYNPIYSLVSISFTI